MQYIVSYRYCFPLAFPIFRFRYALHLSYGTPLSSGCFFFSLVFFKVYGMAWWP